LLRFFSPLGAVRHFPLPHIFSLPSRFWGRLYYDEAMGTQLPHVFFSPASPRMGVPIFFLYLGFSYRQWKRQNDGFMVFPFPPEPSSVVHLFLALLRVLNPVLKLFFLWSSSRSSRSGLGLLAVFVLIQVFMTRFPLNHAR